jgi:predicted phosphoadenosine phosphosulfate sulfurtransferase
LLTFDSGFKISGSKNSELLIEYFSIIRKYNLQNLDLLEIFYKAQIENNQNRIDSVNAQLENLIKRKYLYSLNFAITNSSNEVSPYIAVSQIPDANKGLLRKLYDTLPENIKISKYGKILNNLTID